MTDDYTGRSAADELDPDSMVNMLPPVPRAKIIFASKAAPEMFRLDESGLRKVLNEKGFRPTATDNALRMKLWLEFERAKANNQPKIIINSVLAGICSKEFWEKEYLKSLHRVAWLCCMPVDYQIKMQETLAYAAEQLREILELPLHDPHTGKLNMSLANLKAKIHMMIDMRMHGAPTQRVEQKSLSINVNRSDTNNIQGLISTSNEATLRERMRRLESASREAQHLPKLSDWQTMPVTNIKMGDGEEK